MMKPIDVKHVVTSMTSGRCPECAKPITVRITKKEVGYSCCCGSGGSMTKGTYRNLQNSLGVQDAVPQ